MPGHKWFDCRPGADFSHILNIQVFFSFSKQIAKSAEENGVDSDSVR